MNAQVAAARVGLYKNLSSVAFETAASAPAQVQVGDDVDEEHVMFLLDEIDREMQNEMETTKAQSAIYFLKSPWFLM